MVHFHHPLEAEVVEAAVTCVVAVLPGAVHEVLLCEGDKAASILCDRPFDGSRRAVAPARPARTL